MLNIEFFDLESNVLGTSHDSLHFVNWRLSFTQLAKIIDTFTIRNSIALNDNIFYVKRYIFFLLITVQIAMDCF